MLTRRIVAALALSLVFGSGCAKKAAPAAAGSAGPKQPAPVKLALDWVPEPEFGGFYAGREAGSYARHGLTVEIQGGGAGVPVL